MAHVGPGPHYYRLTTRLLTLLRTNSAKTARWGRDMFPNEFHRLSGSHPSAPTKIVTPGPDEALRMGPSVGPRDRKHSGRAGLADPRSSRTRTELSNEPRRDLEIGAADHVRSGYMGRSVRPPVRRMYRGRAGQTRVPNRPRPRGFVTAVVQAATTRQRTSTLTGSRFS